MSDYDYLFRLVIVGDSGVGKSNIFSRFSDNSFSRNYVSTIGIDFSIRKVKINGKMVKLHLWDTSGQRRFLSISSSYYRSADGVILVYDVNSPESYAHIKDWYDEIYKYRNSSENIPMILVGNKNDLEQKVSTSLGKSFADLCKIKFTECSALHNEGMSDVFVQIAEEILENKIKNSPRITLDRLDNTKKRERCCW